MNNHGVDLLHWSLDVPDNATPDPTTAIGVVKPSGDYIIFPDTAAEIKIAALKAAGCRISLKRTSRGYYYLQAQDYYDDNDSVDNVPMTESKPQSVMDLYLNAL
ncbi:hypothetical protein CTM93_12485 [Photobacterium phosphoreum]|uniref:hypothetical protein n=1 Tax=Photobacterium phosphoreum TaxID=659 RepID=UPI000D1863FD|nr:hypothetical protein [Photobacterium phosphoreum]PSU82895.1 hypothetical protein CTM93_12485 [Photobacterium phosphoreum]